MVFGFGGSLSRPMACASPAVIPKRVGRMTGVGGITRVGRRWFSGVWEKRCVASGVRGKAGICGC